MHEYSYYAYMSTTDITDQGEWQFYIYSIRLLYKNIVLHMTNNKNMWIMKNEYSYSFLKFHAGSDDKLLINFAWP